jgi:lipoprotein-releasing system ATP-binding protein
MTLAFSWINVFGKSNFCKTKEQNFIKMLIDLQNITKYYKNPETDIRQMVLDDISLQINKGDALAIAGPSGSGKSTLLNIMGTLDVPISGNVIFNGVNIKNLNDSEIANIRNRHIGFIFQKHLLLPQLNLYENVLLPTLPIKDKEYKGKASEKARELLSSVGLADKIYQLPGKLSVGECQRAAVVRALINQPELILADEPTGSLDKESAENLGELLKTLNVKFGVALVVVTHSQHLADKMNKIFSLSNGKLV